MTIISTNGLLQEVIRIITERFSDWFLSYPQSKDQSSSLHLASWNPIQFFLLGFSLIFRDNQPQDQVQKYPRNATWYGSDNESQSKPDRVDAKEFSQTTTNSQQDAVIF